MKDGARQVRDDTFPEIDAEALHRRQQAIMDARRQRAKALDQRVVAGKADLDHGANTRR
jgi:hypothetical protein